MWISRTSFVDAVVASLILNVLEVKIDWFVVYCIDVLCQEEYKQDLCGVGLKQKENAFDWL